MQPKTIVLGVRDDKYQSRSRQAAFPVTNSLTIDYILKCGEKLMKEYIAERHGIGAITNLQLSFSGLERAERGQQGIQGFFNPGNTGNLVARASPVPPSIKSPSSKALGKRKAEDTFVDLTLTDEDLSEQDVDTSRSVSTVQVKSLVNGNGHERSRSAASTISDDDDSSDIEIVETAPVGPVYQCPRCAAIISLQADESGDLVAARKRAEKVHKEWHERYAAGNVAPKKAAKDKPPKKKKRKGQQKLKSFFKKC
jgi:hypothetical protein